MFGVDLSMLKVKVQRDPPPGKFREADSCYLEVVGCYLAPVKMLYCEYGEIGMMVDVLVLRFIFP